MLALTCCLRALATLLSIVDQSWQLDGLLYFFLALPAVLLDPAKFPYVWLCLFFPIHYMKYVYIKFKLCRWVQASFPWAAVSLSCPSCLAMGFNRASLQAAVFLSCFSSLIVGSSQAWLRAVVELIQKGIRASLPASSSMPLLLFFSDCRIQSSFAEGSSRVDSKRSSGKLTGEQQCFSPPALFL